MESTMSKNWQRALLCVLALAACVVGVAIAQQVLPNQQRTVTQDEPPGAPLTTQTAFCQTSTGGAQANTITVAALAGKTIYITGFEISGDGATGQSVIAVTLGFGGTTVANYSFNVVAGATSVNPPLAVEYTFPLVAPTVGTSCVLTVPSFGTGNTSASVTLHGFYE
jgi:hypothetical protein